ncbi:MAG: chorismate synthase [Myxococcales bacterium]|nr:chorismate synthase [Myxococcales bacterium]
MANRFGTALSVTTFGESHGPAVGVIVDGCPPRLPVTAALIQAALDRRRPGQSALTSPRREPDQVEILSGLSDDGLTLGTPIALMVRTVDARSKDYAEVEAAYRPSHADYTYDAKFGIRAVAGGGRASARETVGRVAAGVIAEQILAPLGVCVVAWVDEVEGIGAEVDGAVVTRAEVERTPVRCPDPVAAAAMTACIEAVRKDGDSVGGVVRAVARGVPAGWGAPVFDKLDADLAKAMLSIPAVKGFEVGSGFAGTRLRGSTHNDELYTDADGRVRTRTNRSGGIVGGISNGEALTMRIAFKPTATIMRPQATVDRAGAATTLAPRGRHDPCVLPRAVPIVEAMTLLTLADHYLRHRGQCG